MTQAERALLVAMAKMLGKLLIWKNVEGRTEGIQMIEVIQMIEAAHKLEAEQTPDGVAPVEAPSVGLVDCGECRTQGCPTGKCRNAWRVGNLTMTKREALLLAFGSGPFHVERRTNAHAEICNERGKAVALSWNEQAGDRADLLCALLNAELNASGTDGVAAADPAQVNAYWKGFEDGEKRAQQIAASGTDGAKS